MSPQASHLMQVAQEYCDFIESAGTSSRSWLTRIAQLLPRLHAAIANMQIFGGEQGFDLQVDMDERFELYSRLYQLLGDLDPYWMEFDVAQRGQEMSGSLADDLTDIYWELKLGLKGLEQSLDPEQTLRGWHAGYRKHWGQHLVDAERHLYSLSACDRLISSADACRFNPSID